MTAETVGGETDTQLANRLATEAGSLLMELREKLTTDGAPSRFMKDQGDAVAQRFLAGELAAMRPDDAVLSEEGAEDSRRFSSPRVWIVDPLDGTREFSEPPRTDWAVHVALWEHGALTAGAVALPAVGLTLSTDPAPTLQESGRERPIVVTSRSRPAYVTALAAEAVDGDVLPLGSAGAKAMSIVTGVADIYVHAGGMYQWDSAAPAAVAAAAGLHVSRIDGSPIVYNEPDVWLPDLLICRPQYAAPVLDAIMAEWQRWQHG